MMDTPYTYLFIRTDLSPAQRIVQAAHAAHNAGEAFGAHSHLICFRAASQSELIKCSTYLDANGIQHRMFFEPDDDVGYTAICTEPIVGERRRLLRRFSLYKELS